MVDEGLDPAERLGKGDELGALHELERPLLGVGGEGDHSPEPAHLFLRDLVARV
ncbi:Uncharacterised protein [Mycobacteroides abscessus subsp. abscessus]|nr:Uncharacterised protein [Mycobacteroides abscessus subsp. abscessus]